MPMLPDSAGPMPHYTGPGAWALSSPIPYGTLPDIWSAMDTRVGSGRDNMGVPLTTQDAVGTDGWGEWSEVGTCPHANLFCTCMDASEPVVLRRLKKGLLEHR